MTGTLKVIVDWASVETPATQRAPRLPHRLNTNAGATRLLQALSPRRPSPVSVKVNTSMWCSPVDSARCYGPPAAYASSTIRSPVSLKRGTPARCLGAARAPRCPCHLCSLVEVMPIGRDGRDWQVPDQVSGGGWCGWRTCCRPSRLGPFSRCDLTGAQCVQNGLTGPASPAKSPP